MSTTVEQIHKLQMENDERKADLTSQVNAVLGNPNFHKRVIEFIVELTNTHAKNFPNAKTFTCIIDNVVDNVAPYGGWDQAITAYSSLKETVQDHHGEPLEYRVEFLHEFFGPILDELESSQHRFKIKRHDDGDGCLPSTRFVNRFTLSWAV